MDGTLLSTFTKPYQGLNAEAEGDINTWRPLKVFCIYRLVLASLLVLSVILGVSEDLLGEAIPLLFRPTALVYLGLAILCLFAYIRRKPSFTAQVYCGVFIDTVAITLIMHSCGGIESGLGTLLVIAIAAGSILMVGRMASFFAAIASIAILLQQFFSMVNPGPPDADFTKAGFLGATFFATAALSWVLARRIKASEAIAEQKSIDLADLSQLNDHIIKNMQSGVVAVDGDNSIRLMNEAARRMLDWESKHSPKNLEVLSKELSDQLLDWRRLAIVDPDSISTSAGEVIPRFNPLGLRLTGAVLIFLDDASVLDEQAQQLRLAALGRLTGGIAHEIRNPLGAISHAAQLLDEAPDLGKQDKRLLQIIHDHSARMNEIIENILQLSRGAKGMPEPFIMTPWLEQFREDFLFSSGMEPERMTVTVEPEALEARFNMSQLHQIVTNLCQNAIRHGTPDGEQPKIDIHAGHDAKTGRPFLDLTDFGTGIEPEQVQQIFDPFFSTHSQGTGLGLYIAREMCRSNRARLDYLDADQSRTPGGGSRFRITFAENIQTLESV